MTAALCDTTMTPRLDLPCRCETYEGNMGPCAAFSGGANGRCAYCDHGPACHPASWFPAITLWQPWASLIFTPRQHKRHETRGFRLPERLIGQWVAIHAAARSVRRHELAVVLDDLCADQWGRDYETSLPHRRVLGLVRFGPSRPTEGDKPGWVDEVCGDWSRGRWAWPIIQRHQLDEPAKATGRQGWWTVALEPPPQLGDATPPPTQGVKP